MTATPPLPGLVAPAERRVSDAFWKRLEKFILEAAAGMDATPLTSKIETTISGARFEFGSYDVRIDAIKCTVTKTTRGME